MFKYTLEKVPKNNDWSRYERPEPQNPIIDDVVLSVTLSSLLLPSDNNPLERVHSLASRWYHNAKYKIGQYSLKSSYVWRNDSWQRKSNF